MIPLFFCFNSDVSAIGSHRPIDSMIRSVAGLVKNFLKE